MNIVSEIKKNSPFFFMLSFFLIFFSLLVACSNIDREVTRENNESPFEITMMLEFHTSEYPNERIKQLLEAATNTKLNIHFIPDANYNERLNTAFASGTLPMVVPMNFQMFSQYKDAIREGQFWEIGPYLSEFENLSKLKKETLENKKVDGKFYSLYLGRPLSRQGIIYRKDWAENLGISTPTNTRELFEMAKAFTEEDPNRSGKNDTIGITDRSDLVYGSFKTIASWFGVPNEYGIMYDQVYPEFMFPQYLETLNYMRALYANGYINRDFPVTTKNDQQSLLVNGIAGIYIGSMTDVNKLYTDTIQKNHDATFDVQNYIEGPQGDFGIWAIPGFTRVILFPKSAIKTEDDLKSVLAFYDQLMTPEVSNLLLWGIEGEHYEVVDGMARVIDPVLHDAEVRPYLALEIGERETNGAYERYFSYEIQVKADDLTNMNEKYLIHNPAITLYSETKEIDGFRLNQIIEDATIQFIIGQIDEDGFQGAINEWLDQGGKNIIEELTNSYIAQNK
ncbi:MAG: extracellular solute-binding protein [Anaerobacillus sp.]|uniref:extracellular solute-binding protein n=1 Tax=Anaerobacillus sp. TaxID=1872506 RepID=UPI00391C13D4